MNRLGDSGVNVVCVSRLSDHSAFVIPAGPLLLTRRGKTRMFTVSIVFEYGFHRSRESIRQSSMSRTLEMPSRTGYFRRAFEDSPDSLHNVANQQ